MATPEDTTFRKPLTEVDLRGAKEVAESALVGQARAFGAEPVNRAIDEFVSSIVEKVNRDHDDLLRRGVDPNAAKAKEFVGPRQRDDVQVGSTELGTYDLATDTFTPNAAGEAALQRRTAARPASLNQKALALVCRKTKDDPDFAGVRRAWGRLVLELQADMPAEAVRTAKNLIIERLMQDYVRKYGTDPRMEVVALEAGQAAHG